MNASRSRCLAVALLFAVLSAPLPTPVSVAAAADFVPSFRAGGGEKGIRLLQLAADIDLAKAKHEYPRAIALVDQAMELDPDNTDSWLFSRGHFHMWLGDYDAARADFEKAIEVGTGEVLRLGLVQLDLYQGRFAEAEEWLVDALRENLGPTREYFRKRGRRDDSDAIAAYVRGRCAIEAPTVAEIESENRGIERQTGLTAGTLSVDPEDARSPEKALEEFDRAIALRPTLAPAYTWRGKLHAEIGAHELAIADFSRAVGLEPDNLANLRGRAEAREATGDLDGAIADWSRYIELRPSPLGVDDNGRFHRARVSAKKGEWDRAITDYDAAERSHVAGPQIPLIRAMVRVRKGDHDGAVADIAKGVGNNPDMARIHLNRMIESEPDNAWAMLARGLAHFQLGDKFSALKDFDRVFELDDALAVKALPRQFAADYYERGVQAARDKDMATALASFSNVIALDPENPAAYNVRGTLHAQMKNAQPALEDFNNALRLDPDNAEIRYKRGMILAQLNEDELAIGDFTRVIELQPENAQAYIRRAALYRRVGDAEHFQADYARAIDLDPSLKR